MSDSFLCNLCETVVTNSPFEQIERESGRCPTCGSLSRFRTLTHLLSVELFGVSLPVTQWRITEKTIYGISDWVGFGRLAAKTKYVNTQFDRTLYPDAVFLDVRQPTLDVRERADIVICSEVLEHVLAPVQSAFDGLFSILKPGGLLVFTVPYTLDTTVEHFPLLYDWMIERRGEGCILRNTTSTGVRQEFDKLVFHGGGDTVLEMRVFGLTNVLEHLAAAGFTEVRVMRDDIPEYGIRNGNDYSRAIVARRPKKPRS